MIDRNKVVALVRSKGPVLPVNITKELNTSPLFASAILSELVDSKLLKLSSAKIGGSPVYFAEGQEHLLPELLYKYLHEKEKKSFDLLKSRGIIRDREEEPVIRVALRAIKDFAIPFEVRRENDVEIFWKFFTINDADAEKKIREILTAQNPAVQDEKKNFHQTEKEPEKSPKAEFKEEKQPELKTEAKEFQSQENQYRKEQKDPSSERFENQAKPHQETIKHFFKNEQASQQNNNQALHKKKWEEQGQQQSQESQEEEVNEPRIEINEIDLDFSEKLQAYFKENKIIVEEEKIIRKNSEYEYVLRIPSAVGMLCYFCKAKNKKKVSDGDLSSFFVQSQMKKTPGLYLTVGALTKKAKDLLENEFKTIKVKNIEEK